MFKKIIGILACDPNGVIGKDGKLPWNYRDELEHFRATTAGQPLIVGRKTFESMPARAFQNRPLSIVFGKAVNVPEALKDCVIAVSSLEEFQNLALPSEYETAFMAGGGYTAERFLEKGLVSEFFLTRIKKCFKGDDRFTLPLLDGWPDKQLKDTDRYTIHHLTKPENAP